ncbi:lipid-A-disaccharide synthase [SCandidatus Aminicenantes bacterium Aminicenantia_JdfR_composite]|jgi:lipid-A-disaccharide synthase|nr:lipid-A-disaccharide synthase [SCandidatus Aminicenantes bacterium Aminicenantia_JdfR_composite]MCP2597224.1 lipid-A-disaccharide synthase [Candidatus Aminicenantes bacterium AC-335-G13]MCP2597722.1 lipid-A-disaccharide synthase [Candidatus Aminicenantes bacterium AC-335-L06]MCP2621228.1 lipid-A-disaccharide synthase [Candidatus Aminicenantes bacterium AC-334-E05]
MESILIIAGENSGEKYGAQLIKEFKKLSNKYSFFGIGGNWMEKEGVELIFRISDVSLRGIFEIISHIPKVLNIFNSILKEVKNRRPVVSILIDFPDFNLRLAKKLRKMKIPVLYYISPTIWAWRKGRIKKIKKYVNKILLIFPFEMEIYKNYGVNAIFVGHPLLERIKINLSKEDFFRKYGLNSKQKLIAFLPGSREGEIKYHLPVLIEAIQKLKNKIKAQFILVRAENIKEDLIEKYLNSNLDAKVISEDNYEAMYYSDLIISSCGTANLEAALLEKPLITFYKLSPFTYNLGIHFIRIRNYSIVNILAGKRIVPELIQKDFTPENIYKEALRILNSPQITSKMIEEFKKIKKSLGEKGASKKVAEELFNLILEYKKKEE